MSATILNQRHPVAKKDHICTWCGKKINKGEKYYYETQIFEGDFHEIKAHCMCQDVAEHIFREQEPDEGLDMDGFCDYVRNQCAQYTSHLLSMQEQISLVYHKLI